MCSDEEKYHRQEVEVTSVNGFELDRNGGNFDKLAIKAFNRSAADKQMNNPKDIRP